MTISTLKELWHMELMDLYSAEKQILKALPKMIHSATNENLVTALEKHLEISMEHKARLETIGRDTNLTLDGHDCKGIEGIISEGEKMIASISDPDTRDAAIIASAQKVEHYEISGYGTAAAFAKQLEFNDAAHLLAETLNEEKNTNDELSGIAEGGFFISGVNENATEV
ncbi:MAG: ferritin-like domain-containing protein [Microgenomates group bacterium]